MDLRVKILKILILLAITLCACAYDDQTQNTASLMEPAYTVRENLKGTTPTMPTDMGIKESTATMPLPSIQLNESIPIFPETTHSKNDGLGSNSSYQSTCIMYQGKRYIYRCPGIIYDAVEVKEIGSLAYSSEMDIDLSTDSLNLDGCKVTHLSGGLTGDALLVGTEEMLGSLYFPENVSYPELYEYEEELDGSITIIKYRGNEENVILPSQIDGKTVSSIGNNSFGEGAFSNCTSVVTVTIPEGVTTLEDNAFYGCYRLRDIHLPKSLTLIRNCAFNACPDLCNIYFNGNAPQKGNYVFDSPINGITLHYPKDCDGWDGDDWLAFSRMPY